MIKDADAMMPWLSSSEGVASTRWRCFDDFPRSATAIAHQECQVLFIEKPAFLDPLRDDLIIGRKILWAFCRALSVRLRETTHRIVAVFALTRPF